MDPPTHPPIAAPAASASDEAYLEKDVTSPTYMWDGKYVDINLVATTVLQSDQDRAKILLPVTPLAVPDGAASLIPPIASPEAERSHLAAEITPSPVTVVTTSSKPVADRSAVMPLLSDTMNAAEPMNFHTQFHVGTEPVPFYLDIDSGSSLLWLQSRLLGSDPTIPDQSMYKPSASRTSQPWSTTEATITYGDNSRVSVSLFSDVVLVGGLSANQQVLGAATVPKLAQDFAASKANGVLGLGFGLPGSKIPRHPNLVQNLKSENAVKHASFSIVGPRTDPEAAARIDAEGTKQPRGSFVIGSVDPQFYTGDIAWCEQLPDQDRWIVRLDEVRINGKTAYRNQLALIDTGTALIRVSPETFRQIWMGIPGAKLYGKGTDTKTMFTYPVKAIESISFVFGGRGFKMTQMDLTLGRVKEGGVDEMCSSICRTAAGTWNQMPKELWILGGIFLDNLVTIFDFDARKIGFADISPDEPKNIVA